MISCGWYLQDRPGEMDSAASQLSSSPVMADSWEAILEGAGRHSMESMLPEYQGKHGWFGVFSIMCPAPTGDSRDYQ
jgi:hypothetical protein